MTHRGTTNSNIAIILSHPTSDRHADIGYRRFIFAVLSTRTRCESCEAVVLFIHQNSNATPERLGLAFVIIILLACDTLFGFIEPTGQRGDATARMDERTKVQSTPTRRKSCASFDSPSVPLLLLLLLLHQRDYNRSFVQSV